MSFFSDRSIAENTRVLYALPASLPVSVRSSRHQDIVKSHLEADPGLEPSAPASAAKNRDENGEDQGVDVDNQPPITSMPLVLLLLLLPSEAPREDELLWARRWAWRRRPSVRRMVRREKELGRERSVGERKRARETKEQLESVKKSRLGRSCFVDTEGSLSLSFSVSLSQSNRSRRIRATFLLSPLHLPCFLGRALLDSERDNRKRKEVLTFNG